MIFTFDTETQGFSKKVLCGVICNENLSVETFSKKEDMWKEIIRRGHQEFARGHNVYFYAHNLQYDFYRIADLNDTNIKFINTRSPFMIKYKLEPDKRVLREKEFLIRNPDGTIESKTEMVEKIISGKGIYFYDSTSLYRMKLEEIGKRIGHPKSKLPAEIEAKLFSHDENVTYDALEMGQIKKYCANDTIVLMKALQYLKKRLVEENIKPKRMISIGQIAIALFNKKIRDNPVWKRKLTMYKKHKGDYTMEYRHPRKPELIHRAGRAGRIEAFQIGEFDDCTYIDINSIYPFAAIHMNFPDLESEQYWENPLEKMTKEELFYRHEGVTNCLIEKKEEQIGSVCIRNGGENWYPAEKKKLIGTWTHEEIRRYLQEGHQVLDAKWSITYRPMKEGNPLKQFMEYHYEKRKQSAQKKEFHKMVMNNLIGKFAQHQRFDEHEIGGTMEYNERISKGWEVKEFVEGKYVYVKKTPRTNESYAPIIAYNVWAKARNILLSGLQQVPVNDLLYCSTDSIIFKGNHLKKFPISDQMGDYKIVGNKEGKEIIGKHALILGKHAYAIDDEIKLSGINHKGIDLNTLRKGILIDTKMRGLGGKGKESELGTMFQRTIDLRAKSSEWINKKEEIESQSIIMDDYESPETFDYYWKKDL